MTALVFKLLGGLGLFLLGMMLLTDGLKAYAGAALRQALVRFTGTLLKAFALGALVTALVQPSSATTVIGFVSAGLLTLPQALGVVMGASLGALDLEGDVPLETGGGAGLGEAVVLDLASRFAGLGRNALALGRLGHGP